MLGAALLAVIAAYQFQRTIDIPVGGVLDHAVFHGFWGVEVNDRWSRGRSAVVFPEPGPGVRVRAELKLAGWRPRGQALPWVTLDAGAGGVTARPSARGATLDLETITSGWWQSDLLLRLESETFRPGPHDPRDLGVRVRSARLTPLEPVFALRRPPLRPVLMTAAIALLIFVILIRVDVPPRTARQIGWAFALLVFALFTRARPYAVVFSPAVLFALTAVAVFAHLFPRAACILVEVAVEAARAAALGLRALARPLTAGLAVTGLLAVFLAFRAPASMDIDLGSGREVPVAAGFGALDSAAGTTFRHPARGAHLDLRDFGAATWAITVRASREGEGHEKVDLVRAGREGLLVRLDETWREVPFTITVPLGWRAGPVIAFPAAPGDPERTRIDRVRLARARALPSPRLVLAFLGAALLLGAGLVAAGLPGWAAPVAIFVLLAAETTALLAAPVVAIPFAMSFAGIVAAGSMLMAVATGIRTVAARNGRALLLPPAVFAAAGIAFVACLAATTCPLYQGGHFILHSSVAEEIWKGRFLIYYLPYPGSILSQQAQWGSVVVPHPCLPHTVFAPLAALPRPLFYLTEKTVLAVFLATLVLLAALLASGRGPRAAAWTAAAATSLVPAYQLLGLGHVMTVFGLFASALALTFLARHVDRLTERKGFWTLVGLLTLCFLSYFASLLFSVLVLALVTAALARPQPKQARALLAISALAGLLAFGLYYVNWAWPFLSQFFARFVSGTAPSADTALPLLDRLAHQPGKLDYSYGSALIPLAGLVGLAWLARFRERVVLLAWAAVLPVVMVFDLAFNFILKHHYFVMVPVAVGIGLLLDRLAERRWIGTIAAVVLLALMAALAAAKAIDVAMGNAV